MAFTREALTIDCVAEAGRIGACMRSYLTSVRRNGLVVGLSGGIDSSVTAALAVRALGKDRVFGLLMPERESDERTLTASRGVAEALGIVYRLEEITGILQAFDFYERYAAALRRVLPDYDSSWKSKVVIHPVAGSTAFSYFNVVAQSPSGETFTERLPLISYLEVVAATNFKQRTRKALEYHHADRLNFAVAGTPNRLEYDQGFFVKLGDGAADIKPIAHLYKSQVYQLAGFLELPDEVRRRPPTTDTYSLPQGQDEFYFSIPHPQMDLCLLGKNRGIPADEVAAAAGLSTDHVRAIWADIDRKRQTTRYLHLPAELAEPIAERAPGK